MAVPAIVNDKGQITNNGKTAAEKAQEKAKQGNTLNDYKDQFMQLLCAQMKYQDPLEPTSNTEYISQYAQFTQVEQMQNMADAMTLSRASDMVGKYVQIQETDDDGNTKIAKEGLVDYVTFQGGKAYVNIDGESYEANKVSAVMEQQYFGDVKRADELREVLKKLPNPEDLSLALHQDYLEKMLTLHNSMDAHNIEKLMTTTELSRIDEYAHKYDELLTIEAAQKNGQGAGTQEGNTSAEEQTGTEEVEEATEVTES